VAVSDQTTELRMLGQEMLRLKGKIATLSSEIDRLNSEIKANEDSQAEATTLRQERNAAWMAETTEMKEALAALQEAMLVLVEGSGGKLEESTLIQRPVQSAKAVRTVLQKLPSKSTMKPEKMSLLMEFAQEKYQPQSQTVQGILGEMYETFAANVEEKTNTEAMQNKDFENFIAAMQTSVNEKKAEIAADETKKAESEAALADTTQTYEDVTAERAEDTAFFDETVQHCKDAYAEWETRKSLRVEELQGVTKALEILTSDEALEAASKV